MGDSIVEDIIKEKNLAKMPPSELDALVQSILKEEDNESIILDYLAGNQKAMNALVGKVMEQAKMRADPKEIISKLEFYIFGSILECRLRDVIAHGETIEK